MRDILFYLGIGGAAVAGVCCFTPVLPLVLGWLGLSGLLGVLHNDTLLLASLAGFVVLAVAARLARLP